MKRFFLLALCLCNLSTLMSMSSEAIEKIGKQIWQNEANCKVDLLVFWNQHEPFPSLGIGHGIWYPEEYKAEHIEQFPLLCAYLKKNGIKLPAWLDKAYQKGAPWKTREEFYKDETKIKDLQTLLVDTIALQSKFMVERLEEKCPHILQAVPENKRKYIANCLDIMKSTLLGTYALIDYLNFKGAGLQTEGAWGLLQVLLDMPADVKGENVLNAFSVSCAKVLLKRIENAAPRYNLNRFLAGWMKRVNTYCDQELFLSK